MNFEGYKKVAREVLASDGLPPIATRLHEPGESSRRDADRRTGVPGMHFCFRFGSNLAQAMGF